MFINCPNCSALVATDLASDLPPERCPRCGFGPLGRHDQTPGPAFPKPPARASAPPPAPPTGPAPVFVPLRPSAPPASKDTPDAAAGAAPRATPPQQPVPPEAAPGAPPGSRTPDPLPVPMPAPRAAAPGPPVPPGAGRPAPGFLARYRSAGDRGRRPREVAVAAGLALLLVVQLLLADRARLAADAGWRPLVAFLCGGLRCTLPPWREPAAIAVEQRDVRPLPERAGVLRVSATIRNNARWAQAWPRLTLTLSDIEGRALGMRAFAPAEYLVQPPQDLTLASGAVAAIGMDIVEPSPHAVAFNFHFD